MKKEKNKHIKMLVGKHLGFLFALALPIGLLQTFFGSACPLYIIAKINCPFCGMTRAHLAALRLDFASAFYYHPLFFLGGPYIFALIHDASILRNCPKWLITFRKVFVIVTTILLIFVYFLRILSNGIDIFAMA